MVPPERSAERSAELILVEHGFRGLEVLIDARLRTVGRKAERKKPGDGDQGHAGIVRKLRADSGEAELGRLDVSERLD